MIRVLIAEDQEIVRRGLRLLLRTQADIEVVSEAENGQQAVDLIKTLTIEGQQPNVVLMDIKMPILDGVAATKILAEQFPDVKIVVLTTFEDSQFVSEALSYGAKGYLLKDTPLEELSDVIRSIAKGYTQFGPGILEKIVPNVQASPPQEPPLEFESLSTKEKEVLALIVQGASNKEIAAALFISEGTVRNHVTHILGRLNVRDRTQAAVIANPFLGYLQGKTS
ncbi:MAG: response regulator transcription factor [Cyanobacteria bacterium P01_H01_bin.21]